MYRYDEFDHQFVRERTNQFRNQTERRLSGDVSIEETVSVAAEGIAFETIPAVAAPRPAEVIAFPVREDIREEILRAAS